MGLGLPGELCEPPCSSSKSRFLAQGGTRCPIPPQCSPSHCSTRLRSDVITPAKANPCRPCLLGRAPRKAVFPCKVRGHEYFMPEEDISFRRMSHELWRSWEEQAGAILAGPAPTEGLGAAVVLTWCRGSQVAEGGSGQGCPHWEVQPCPDVGLFASKQSRLVPA